MGRLGRLFEVALVEIEHCVWGCRCGHGRSLQNLVIEGNRQFAFIEIGAEEDVKARATDNSLSRGGPLNRIKQRLGCEADLNEQKSTAQRKILKWR